MGLNLKEDETTKDRSDLSFNFDKEGKLVLDFKDLSGLTYENEGIKVDISSGIFFNLVLL